MNISLFLVGVIVSAILGVANAQQESTKQPLDCTFDRFQSCQKISALANTKTDNAGKCGTLTEALNCYKSFGSCSNSDIQRYMSEATNALNNRLNRECVGTPIATGLCADMFAACISPLEKVAGSSQEETCRIIAKAVDCFNDLGSCEQDDKLKPHIESYRAGLSEGYKQCSGTPNGTGLCAEMFAACVSPFEKVAGSSSEETCRAFFYAKQCFLGLKQDEKCKDDEQLEAVDEYMNRIKDFETQFCNDDGDGDFVDGGPKSVQALLPLLMTLSMVAILYNFK